MIDPTDTSPVIINLPKGTNLKKRPMLWNDSVVRTETNNKRINKNIVAKQTFIDWLAECPVKAIRNDDLNFGDHEDSEEINYSFYIPYE